METFIAKKPRRGKLIHIRLTPKTHQKLKVMVAEKGTTIQEWVSRSIRRELRRQRALVLKAMKDREKTEKPEASEKVVKEPQESPKGPKKLSPAKADKP